MTVARTLAGNGAVVWGTYFTNKCGNLPQQSALGESGTPGSLNNLCSDVSLGLCKRCGTTSSFHLGPLVLSCFNATCLRAQYKQYKSGVVNTVHARLNSLRALTLPRRGAVVS